MTKLPLQITTEDGYDFQLTTDKQRYITGDMNFAVSDITLDESTSRLWGWIGDKETGVSFNVTIPMPADNVKFAHSRIPGIMICKSDDSYYQLWYDENVATYESSHDPLMVSEVLAAFQNEGSSDEDNIVCLEDGTSFDILTWVMPMPTDFTLHLFLSKTLTHPWTANRVIEADGYFYTQYQSNQGSWVNKGTWKDLNDAIAYLLPQMLSSNLMETISSSVETKYQRLISAMNEVGVPTNFIEEIAEKMGLTYEEASELFD